MVIEMDEMYINSISEYLDKLEELGKEYPKNPIMSSPIKNAFLFRGMEDCKYELLPNIFRRTEDRINDSSIINSKYLGFANELGILQNFIQEASAYVSQFDTYNYVRWAELAQHFGVPTRFLDWTENPLVALYFACESNKDCDAVVWVLHKRNYLTYVNEHDENRFKDNNKYATNEEAIKDLLITPVTDGIKYSKLWKLPIIYTPYYFDHRMSAQASWFMVWGIQKSPLEGLVNSSCYMKYEPPTNGFRTFGISQEERFLYRFLIHQSEKQRIMRRLDHMGIHAKSLFPGLDGIGKHIERIYRFDYNEVSRNL